VGNPKLIFAAMALLLFGMIPLFVPDRRRYFLAFACMIHPFTSGWIFYHYTGLMLADLPMIGLLVFSLLSGRRMRIRQGAVGASLAGIVIWGAVTALWAVNPGWVMAEVSKYARMYLLLVCFVHNVRDLRDLRFAVHWMLVGLMLQALIGIYQWQFGALGIWFLGERPAWRVDWRSMGTFFVAAFYANYLAMNLQVAFRLFAFYATPRLGAAILYGAACATGFVAFYASYARGPWIGFVVALAAVTLYSLFRTRFRMQNRWGLPVLLVFLSLFVFRYHTQIIDQFGEGRRAAIESRFPQYRVAGRIISDRPLGGVGCGNYELVSWDYLTPEEKSSHMARVTAWMVHNSYLLMTAEMGVPGGLLMVAWFLSMCALAFRILRARLSHPFIANLAYAILAGTVSMIIFLLSGPDIHEYSILYQVTLFCGMLIAMRNILGEAERRSLEAKRAAAAAPTRPVPDKA
jgi:O-antigen ligase